MNIESITCTGSSREMGEAQGAAAADQVRRCHAALDDLEAFRTLQPRWLTLGAFLRLAEWRATRLWRSSIEQEVPRAADRVRGIAHGAQVRPGAVKLLNILEPLMSDIRDQTEMPPLGGCSAIAVSPEATATGEPMIARNFDYLPLIQPFYLMRDCRPTTGFRSLEFTCAPMAGAVDGLNEAGLCITCNYAYCTDSPDHAGTISMAIADALAQCETVSEAAEFLSSRRRWGGGLLMLAGSSGDVASLELSNQRSFLRRPGVGDNGVIYHTNRYHSSAMRTVEIPDHAAFARRAPTPLRGRRVHDSSDARDARFSDLLAHARPLSREGLTAIMADHGSDGTPSHETICMHSDYWSTTATLQFFPRSRQVRVAFDSACRARFSEFEVGYSARVS